MAHQHSLDYIKSILGRIGSSLASSVTAYHIGGNAMCWYGLKDATRDTDLVFIDKGGVNEFEKALLSFGFLRTDEHIRYRIGEPYARYSEIKNTPLNEPFTPGLDVDLFLGDICGKMRFSRGMISRSVDAWGLGNLKNKMCSREDIFIFKAVTGRPEDINDMASLAESGLKLDIITEEYSNQLSKLPTTVSSEIKGVFIDSVSNLKGSGVTLPASFIRKITKF